MAVFRYSKLILLGLVIIILAACSQTQQPILQEDELQLETASTHATADPGFLGNLADPNQITFTLEGCRLPAGATLPSSLVCADGQYTTGNLGKSWNELDLVPHRVTLKNGSGQQSYTFVVSGDYTSKAGDAPGKVGWDVISRLTLNTRLSQGQCPEAVVGPEVISPSGSGVGGADQTIYRMVDINNQSAGSTCIYDYYQRLALGASKFSGSSLQSNLWNKSLTSSGIGQKRISLPVKDIAPQELSTTLSATRGSRHDWTLEKTATPTNLNFTDTCQALDGAREATVTVTIEWTRSDATASGPATVRAVVTATNPAHREITVHVNNEIFHGSTPGAPGTGIATLRTAAEGVNVPPNTSTTVLEHEFVDNSPASSYSNRATARYQDKITGAAVPGTTEATASADTVTSSKPNENASAVITDVMQLTGADRAPGGADPLRFSVAAPSVGSFTDYTAGTWTTGPVTWRHEVSGSGSVTFTKTVLVRSPGSTSGTLSDVVTLNSNGSLTRTANAATTISADRRVNLTITKTIPAGSGAHTFTFDITGPSGYSSSESITIAAGQTSNSVTISNLASGEYRVTERPATGWNPQDPQTVNIAGTSLETCGATVTFNNTLPAVTATKTAAGSYDRTITWTLEKNVDDDSHSGQAGQDAGSSEWSVVATKTETLGNYRVTGNIVITNPSAVARSFSVTDTLNDSDSTTAIVNCPVSTVPANDSVTCTYTASPADRTATLNTATVTIDGSPITATAPVSFLETVIGSESATLEDPRFKYEETITETTTFREPETFACSADPGLYSNGSYTRRETNIATLTFGSTTLTDDAHVDVVCVLPALTATKTAAGSYDRTITWDLVKSVDPYSHSGQAGDSFNSTWSVTATKSVVENNNSVTGNITINNPAAVAVPFTVSDVLNDSTTASVTCPAPSVPANDSVTCTYTASPAGRTATLNTATVSGTGNAPITATAPVSFTANVIGSESATLEDPRFKYEETISTTTPLTFPETFPCSSNPGDYVNGTHTRTETNVATLQVGSSTITRNATVDITCTMPQDWKGETATGAGKQWPGTSNWFMYTAYTTSKVDLIAGQHFDAGDIFMSRSGSTTTIRIVLHAGYRWADVADNLKIQPLNSEPKSYMEPGSFQYKFRVSGSEITVQIPNSGKAKFFGIHGDVERRLP